MSKKSKAVNTKSQNTSKKPQSSFKLFSSKQMLPLGVALLLAIIAFAPSLKNKFVNWDDDVNVLENKSIYQLTWPNVKQIFREDVIGNYNPLPIFTFAVEHHFVDKLPNKFDHPWIFHFNNLLLHLLCIFFAFLIVSELGLSPWAAGLVAMLFAIHPMRVESVAWITERKDVLFGAFYLWALWLYVKWVKNPERKSLHFWIVTLFIFSLFSKIQAVSLPLSMLAVDYLMKRPLTWRLLVEKIPYFALSLLFGLIGVFMLKANNSLDDTTHYDLIGRLCIGAFSFIVYLIKWIIPYRMSPLYAYPQSLDWSIYAAVIPALMVLGLIYLLWKRDKKEWAFALVFFVVNVAFVLQILGAGQGFLADRFTYIPYLGLFFGMGYTYDQYKSIPAYKNIIPIGIFIYLGIFLFMTMSQVRIWENGETLWTHVMKYETKTPLPFSNRAMYFRGLKEYDKALYDFNKALAIKPQGTTYNSIGKMYFDQGKNKEAFDNYKKAIELDKTKGEFFINMGASMAMDGQYENALKAMNEGIRLDSNNLNGYLNRSLLHYTMQNYELAIKDHTVYLQLDPSKYEMYYERGICKAALKKYDEAILDFNKAIEFEKRDLFFLERGKAYFMLGKKELAQEDMKTAQSLGMQIPDGILQQVGLK